MEKVVMAVAAGKESSEGVSFPKYTGLIPFFVVALNPTKAELEKIYADSGRKINLQNEPVYLTTDENGVKNLRVEVVFKSDKDKSGVDLIHRESFWLRQRERVSQKGTKQVSNAFGEFTWLTPEDIASKTIPAGRVYGTKDIRPAVDGEEGPTALLKAYLNIPLAMWKQKDGSIGQIPELSEGYCQLEQIDSWFEKGDITELRESFGLKPENKVTLLMGVRKTEDGKYYQQAYKEMPLKYGTTKFDRLIKDVTSRQEAGAYPNTFFNLRDLSIKEFSEVPTDLATIANSVPDIPADDWGNVDDLPY